MAPETSDQARNTLEEITITRSTKTRESLPGVNQDHFSQHNDTHPVSPAYLVNDQKMSDLACQVLERETGLRTSADPQPGVNRLQLDAKETSSPKQVSRILNQNLESEIEKTVATSGQALQTEFLQETQKVTRPSKFGSGEESVNLPPVDVNLQQRPARRKRIFVGQIQRFVDEDTEVLMSGNSATVTNSESGRLGKTSAILKTAKPRGRPKKILNVIRQGSPLKGTSTGKKTGKTKSSMQSSQLQGFVEKQKRRRGRPKKTASIIGEAGDPDRVTRSIKPNEGDLGEHQCQIRNPQENPSTESEEQPIHDIKGQVCGPTLYNVSRNPQLDKSLYAQAVNPHGNPPLETDKQSQKGLISPAEAIHPLDKSSNAHLDNVGTGMYPTKLQSEARGHLSKKPRLRGEADAPSGASHSSRIYGSELDMHIVDPCENLSPGTQGQSSKVSTIQGQTSYSPGNFYSALFSKSKYNTEAANSIKNASSTIREQAQTIPQTHETAPKNRLALLQRQSTKKLSKKKGDLNSSFAPALERVEKEGVSQRLEGHNDEMSFEPPQTTDSSTNQPGQSGVHPERQLQALTTSKPNDTEPPPRDGGDPQTQVPSKKRGRPKKEAVPNAELPPKSKKAKEGSKAEGHFASSTPFTNLMPVNVYRLSCDRGESATTTADPAVFIDDKYITATDVMAQICHEFAVKSHALANHLVQSPSRIPSKAELKRKLEVNEDGRGTLNGSLFQLVCVF